MTSNYRATDRDWNWVEATGNHQTPAYPSCILELRARVEALEAKQRSLRTRVLRRLCLHLGTPRQGEALEAKQRIRSGPESPLVERVAVAISDADERIPTDGSVNIYSPEARAAILQVALWLREQGTPALGWVMRLEQEAGK